MNDINNLIQPIISEAFLGAKMKAKFEPSIPWNHLRKFFFVDLIYELEVV